MIVCHSLHPGQKERAMTAIRNFSTTACAIASCHQQIEDQCKRLAEQTRADGQATRESRFLLLCLSHSLTALERAQTVLRK
jgi:hypothetical protein